VALPLPFGYKSRLGLAPLFAPALLCSCFPFF
jgi:hypothetical protein